MDLLTRNRRGPESSGAEDGEDDRQIASSSEVSSDVWQYEFLCPVHLKHYFPGSTLVTSQMGRLVRSHPTSAIGYRAMTLYLGLLCH